MHGSVLDFLRTHVDAFPGRKVLEVGSYNFNGSAREVIEPAAPAFYLGVDVVAGPGVDLVVEPGADLPSASYAISGGMYGWDVVVSTEMLEHAPDWRRALGELKRATAPGGVLFLTTRSRGMPYHAFPIDCWRFSLENMLDAFADWDIEAATGDPDPRHPGVFVRARRPLSDRPPVDLATISAYPMRDAPK